MERVRAYLEDLFRYPSLIGTVLVNFSPLIGVVLWGWGVGPLVILYWLENVIVGFITLARMALSGASSLGAAVSLLFLMPFFCVHYGLFCFVHGIFVLLFAGLSNGIEHAEANLPDQALNGGPLGLFETALHAAPGATFILAVIGGWRVILTLMHYVLRGEFRRSNPAAEMGKPYVRIITLHFAIFAGAFGLFWLKQPAWGMLALILLKAAFDFFGVRNEVKGSPSAAILNKEGAAAVQALDQALKARIFKRPPPAA